MAKVKTCVKSVHMSQEHCQMIMEKAQSANISVSEYLLSRGLGYTIHSATDQKMISELCRIGGLVKHMFNETHGHYSIEFLDLLKELKAAITRIGKDE